MKKLSPAQVRTLLNTLHYADPGLGVVGQSAHGGHSGTMAVLQREKLLKHTGKKWIVTSRGITRLKGHYFPRAVPLHPEGKPLLGVEEASLRELTSWRAP